MTTKRKRAARPGVDRCRCGSEDLFSGFFDADDLAVNHEVNSDLIQLLRQVADGVRWTTFCMQCGSEVSA